MALLHLQLLIGHRTAKDKHMPLNLTKQELNTFTTDGVIVLHWRIKEDHIRLLLEQLSTLASRVDTVALESDGRTLRALHGGYEDNPILNRITQLDALLAPAEQILHDPVYVYQLKINLKAAFAGDVWPWHQDFSFWAKEDEMPSPRALTAAIFLDDVTEFNGPMFFIPGSHRSGCHDAQDRPSNRESGDAWRRHVGVALSYQTDKAKVMDLTAEHGLLAPKGPRGTIMFFDCNIVHASPANISPMNRRMLFITYNSVNNLPTRLQRPSFLVNRDFRPLTSVEVPDIIELAT